MAIKQNFVVFSGNDVVLDVALIDEEQSPPVPLLLNGTQELIFAIARRSMRSTPIVEKTLDDGIEITNAVDGTIAITLSSADLEPLKGVYLHELRITNQAGKKITLMYGEVRINVNMIEN